MIDKLNVNDCQKIIATTDTSLGIALIPQQFINYFIKQYNRGNAIKEVLVEYRRWTEFNGNHSNTPTIDVLMVNPDNIINIKPIKDSWNRKEVIELLSKIRIDLDKTMVISNESFVKWIEENL